MTLFYVSPLRERIENKLFDLRSRLAPDLVRADPVAFVTIDNETITKLAPPGAKDLSAQELASIVSTLRGSKAKRIVVLLHSQVFPYTEAAMADLVELAAQDSRILLCLFDVAILKTPAASDKLLPFTRVSHQVASCELPRDYRRGVVRQYPVGNPVGLPFLAELVADQTFLGPLQTTGGDRTLGVEDFAYRQLNYMNLEHFTQIPAHNLIAEGPRPEFDGKTVFVGYTAYRGWTFKHREATFANTPWQADGDDVKAGLPIVYLHGFATANLLAKAWLHPSSPMVTALHTLILALLGYFIWRLSAGLASLIFLGGWCGVLLIHALLFAVWHVYIPLADSMLFSSLATVCGALQRLSWEGQHRARKQAQASSEQQVAQVQERFLDRFAFELGAINTRIQALLGEHKNLGSGTGTLQKAYVKAVGSSEELGEYLAGMQQFVTMRAIELRRSDLSLFGLDPVLRIVMSQFESRIREKKMRLVQSGDSQVTVSGEKTLVTQIIFNLVSNAIKYSPDGSTIKLHCEQQGDRVAVAVADQGPGIPEEQQAKIFEKFYRVKNDLVHSVKGHGLGLYLSQFFASQMGAEISVHSIPGQGATFTLLLKRKM